ncbi:MAG TPA: hypothetical protein VG225_15795 [Terracidiphilus sp.]|jgi:hypothetical protein|nr:hypothetical protein [Terracidiphilus sp.]
MEIGPIAPIRPVAMVAPARTASDLAGVFAIEFRNQQPDDSYSPARKASRGLEDENTEDQNAEEETADHEDSEPATESGERSLSFFA